MKIIDILTYGVNLGDGNHVFVKVISDEHFYGIGEAYRVGPDAATIAVIDDFKRWLVGEDPFRIEHLWRLMYNGSRFPGGSIGSAALSGIEIALWDLKGRALGREVGVPIATGEMLYTKYAFRDILAGGAADILQPDLLICGGLLEAKKIAAMAEAHYVSVAPHSPLGPVSTAVAVQFAASTPNFLILEYQPDQAGPSRDLVRKPLVLEDGHLRIPDQPGLGIELNEAAFAGKPLKPWHRAFVIEADGNVGYQ